MKNIKLNINRNIPSSEEINSKRDFGKLMENISNPNINKSPSYKNWIKPSLYISTAIILTSVIVFLLSNKDKTLKPSVVQRADSSFVNPPLKSINSEFETFIIANNKENTLFHPNGTTLYFKPYTFGNQEDSVEISYREFKTPCEMLFSGIPMTYDSCGKTYQFESGGMFEILAYRKGEPVQIAKGKEIEIDFLATTKDKTFNFYELDTNKRNWKYLGKDEPQSKKDFTYKYADNSKQIKEQNILEYAKLDEQIKKLETQIPALPSQPNIKRYRFNIDVDRKEFPELLAYKNLQFEIVTADRPYGREIYNIVWESASLKQSKKGLYKLSISNSKEKYNLYVQPVFEGKDYDSALSVYNKAFVSYQNTIETNKKIKNNLELKYQQAKAHAQMQASKYVVAADSTNSLVNTKKAILESYINKYKIRSTGIFNCDKPIELPKGRSLNIAFRNSDGSILSIRHAFLLINDRNSYYNISGTKLLSFNPNKENTIVVIDENGRIGIIDNKTISSIPNQMREFAFTPKFNNTIKTAKDLELLIGS